MQTRYGGFALSIKIGLSFGGLQIDTIESDTGQARLLASGDALTWAGQAEHSAERGQIAYHASIDTIGGAGAFASFGGSDVNTVAGPVHSVAFGERIVPIVGENATASLAISVDERTGSLAVDPISGHYVTTVGVSGGPSFGAEGSVHVSASPAFVPGIPDPLNNTWRVW